MTPEGNPPIRLTTQLIAGLALAGLGVLFTLNNMHILHAREVLRYWPAVLLVIGVSQIVQARSIASMIGGSIWILFGGVLLGERLHVISSVLGYWPLLLVGVGVYVVWQSFNHGDVARSGDPTDRLSAIAVLGGVDRRVTSQGFQGADITAFMGGGKLDLREAGLAGPEAVVDVLTIMGGFEIRVPETWSVVVEVIPFMAGYEDKTRHPADPLAPRLRVRGFVMMGGLDIRN